MKLIGLSYLPSGSKFKFKLALTNNKVLPTQLSQYFDQTNFCSSITDAKFVFGMGKTPSLGNHLYIIRTFAPMMYITRRERFNAAHKLYRDEWTLEENERIFGKCSNPNWHGHNYELFVTVRGTINPKTGFLIDLKLLKSIIETHVIEKLDHRNINLDVDFMKGKMASTEVLAMAIFEELKAPIEDHGVTLHAIRLHETENNYVEYFGE